MARRTANLVGAALAALLAMAAGSAFLPGGIGVFASWKLAGWGWRLWNIAGSGEFVQVSDGLHRLDLWWRPLPVVVYPLTAYLVKDTTDSWVLIDSGMSDSWSQRYASELVGALQRKLGRSGELRAILQTHGHPDHVGALPALLDAYPNTPVVIHEDEVPFVTGRAEYLPSGSPIVKTLRALGILPAQPVQVPKSRLTVLRGEADQGDLTHLGIASLTWISSPGHTPGHISFFHRPTATLLAGDAVQSIIPSVSLAGGIESLITRPLGWMTRPFARLALGRLFALGSARQAVADFASRFMAMANDTSPPASLINKVAAVAGAAGDITSSTSIAGGGAELGGQVIGTYRLLPFLPGVTLRAGTPSLLCPKPACDLKAAHRSICKLAAMQWKRVMPMHDITSKGLGQKEMRAFAETLPECR